MTPSRGDRRTGLKRATSGSDSNVSCRLSPDEVNVDGTDNDADRATKSVVDRLPRPSATLVVAVGVAARILGSLLPALLANAGPTDPYWLAVPAIIAAARFGLAGAVATSVTRALVTGPLARLLPWSDRTMHASWVERALFYLIVSATVAVLVKRTQAADARAM